MKQEKKPDEKTEQQHQPELDAYSIEAFCRRHSISRSMYYNLKTAGKGPREAHALGRVLITKGMENTNKMTFRERMKFKAVLTPDPVPALAFVGHEDTMRLACMTKVHGDIEVETGPEVNLFGENFFS